MQLLPAMILLVSLEQQQAVEPAAIKADVRRHLATAYDGGAATGGLRYDPNAPLEHVPTAELGRFLPGTTFFITTLSSPHLGYPDVPAVLGYTPGNQKPQLKVCLSPVFTRVSPEFLAIFEQLPTESPKQRRQLALGIGKLLAVGTERGSARKVQVGAAEARLQLWHGKRHWRDVEVRFSKSGSVASVQVAKPRK